MSFIRFAKSFFFTLTVVGSVTLCACAEKTVEEKPAEDMVVDVNFQEVHRCSRISPEITVAYAPRGTKFYDVRLVELGERERFLGGGRWVEDGNGLIPEGALTNHYTGPCPPRDRVIEYAYYVAAMEEGNPQPLAVRVYKFKPE